MEVGAIKQPTVVFWKSAHEDVQANVGMGAVWERSNQFSSRPQKVSNPQQGLPGIPQMFQKVSTKGVVEGAH